MDRMELRYTIPLAPVTKKNHQQIMYNARTGRRFVKPSPAEPICTPVNVRCLFYLPTRRRTDLVNLLQAVDDILVEAGILADDNYCIVAGHDGSRVYYDKQNPRTEIGIEGKTDECGI